MYVSPSVSGGSTPRFDVDDMLPLLLTRSWCATWFILTRHGGGVFYALRLFCGILVDVMTSFHLLFLSFFILSISLFPDSMVLHQKGCLNICSWMLDIFFEELVRPATYSARHTLGMRLLDASNTS